MTALWYCIFSHLFRPDSTSPLQSWMVWSMFWVERTKTLRSSSRWRCLTPIAMFGEYNQKWPQCAKWGLALFCTNPHTLTAILSCFSHFVSLFFSSVAVPPWKRDCMWWAEDRMGRFMTLWSPMTPKPSSGLQSALFRKGGKVFKRTFIHLADNSIQSNL